MIFPAAKKIEGSRFFFAPMNLSPSELDKPMAGGFVSAVKRATARFAAELTQRLRAALGGPVGLLFWHHDATSMGCLMCWDGPPPQGGMVPWAGIEPATSRSLPWSCASLQSCALPAELPRPFSPSRNARRCI